MKENEIYFNDTIIDNYFSDSDEDNEEIINNEELTKRVLDIKKYDRMIKDIIVSIDDGMIYLSPDYQRNYIWDNKKASKLIESILLNIPIPVIYASEEEDGKWNIIDGLQRLYSLHRFYKNDLKLSGLEVLSELNGKKYFDLQDSLRNKIDRGDLTIILLLQSSSKDIQYDIFMRLNTGAVKLNEQELRNCLYRGKLNDLVKNELINNEDFVNIFNFKDLHKRMFDSEIVLRYLAFSDNYNIKEKCIDNYNGRIKNIVNNFMIKYQKIDQLTLDKFRDKFNTNIKKCWQIFDNKAFKKQNISGDYDTRTNRPLFETIMICFEKYDLNVLLKHKKKIIEETEKLIKSKDFNDLISTATGNSTKTNNRLKIYSNLLEGIINDNRNTL